MSVSVCVAVTITSPHHHDGLEVMAMSATTVTYRREREICKRMYTMAGELNDDGLYAMTCQAVNTLVLEGDEIRVFPG